MNPSVLQTAIERLDPPGGRLEVDAFKLPHHGSQNNNSREMIEMVSSPRYLVSTSGDIFHHPDVEAIARVVQFAGGTPELIFNYLSSFNGMWKNEKLERKHSYRAVYPKAGESGIVLDL